MPNLRPWSDSLLVRIVLVMVIGVISAQLLGAWLLTRQMRETVRNEALSAGRFLAVNAAGSIRFFRDLPPPYRPILIEQLRTMGGTRFFINVNSAYVPVKAIEGNALVDGVVDAVHDELVRAFKGTPVGKVCFAWPDGLQVSEDGRLVSQLPASWVEATLLLRPRPAPVLVMQIKFEEGHWLYLAATMPDPYFLDNADPLTWERITPQLVMLLAVLLWAVWMVWALVYPINRIAAAANAVGSAGLPEPIPETGTAELRRTARAFNAMHARIQGYLLDRERLFIGISHSLRTPITRLKLRTELLDDEAMRNAFHEDLDDLDVMVKSALQSMRETDVYENRVVVRLDRLLARLVQRPIHPNAHIDYQPTAISVLGKPLALQRALRNLLDNAVLYGDRVELRLCRKGSMALVEIRDFGPGLAETSMLVAFEPQMRLAHGQSRNPGGSGLGLGISRNIVQAHGGEIQMRNHPEGGLVVSVLLPAQPDLLDLPYSAP